MINERMQYNYMFQLVCENGHEGAARWLHSLKVIDIKTYTHAFPHVCENGHITIAKWLHAIGCVHVSDYNYAFQLVCANKNAKSLGGYILSDVSIFILTMMRHLVTHVLMVMRASHAGCTLLELTFM